MEFFDLYFSQSGVDLVVSTLGLFPVGVLLAVLAWMVTIVVHACFRWLRG